MIGFEQFSAAIDKVIAQADAAAKATVAQAAAELEKSAKSNFSGTHKRGQPHVGGDLPNVVTGTLRRSITHEPVKKIGLGTWATTVGPTVVYGRRVELGLNGSKAYAYFSPAYRDLLKRFRDIAAENWRKALSP